MSSAPEEFKDLRRLLALKRHEEPPPGYFNYLPDKILNKIERLEAHDLAEHSTWWEWLVERFDARPLLAGAYTFVISGLLLMGFKVSHMLEADPEQSIGGGGWLAATPDPNTVTPSPFLQSHFANPAGLVTFSSMDPVIEPDSSPLPLTTRFSSQHGLFAAPVAP